MTKTLIFYVITAKSWMKYCYPGRPTPNRRASPERVSAAISLQRRPDDRGFHAAPRSDPVPAQGRARLAERAAGLGDRGAAPGDVSVPPRLPAHPALADARHHAQGPGPV